MNPETVTLTVFFTLLIVLVLYMIRLFLAVHRRRTKSGTNDSGQVGFIVDTFHDLVAKLKEKETELEIMRKKAEDRASSIELYNENIFQSVSSGIVSFDNEHKITKINSSAEKILGLKDSEIIGRSHSEVFHKPISEFIEQNRSIERQECSYVTHSGNRIWLGLTISPLKDSSDSTIGQILVFTDLTELKAFQSQLELRERLSTLGEMSAGIAHEFRNPMAVISGYTKLLSKKVDTSLMPAVEAIAKEVAGMDRIISDFLSFAKPTELVASNIKLKELIEDCIRSVEDSAEKVQIKLRCSGDFIINADEVLLKQCIVNIFNNAVESMPDGGSLNIDISGGNFLNITITDSGHGISGNIRDKIFLPFFTTKERGTGLGLSIVHKTVVSHGGEISVDSSERGTSFVIRLPEEIIIEQSP